MSSPQLQLHAIETKINDLSEMVCEDRCRYSEAGDSRLATIATEFYKLCERIKHDPDAIKDALKLQSTIQDLWHRMPSNREDIDQCFRYVAETDTLPTAMAAKVLWNLYRLSPTSPVMFQTSALRKMREASILERTASSRGDVCRTAHVAGDKSEFVRELIHHFNQAGARTRSEFALALGEWGGPDEVLLLRDRLLLHPKSDDDRSFKASVIAALANIGGQVAVDTLLQLAEEKDEALAGTALSSLEFLSTGGSTALTEAPDPPTVDSPELLAAYQQLAQRLSALARSETATEYARHRARQIWDTIGLALDTIPAASRRAPRPAPKSSPARFARARRSAGHGTHPRAPG